MKLYPGILLLTIVLSSCSSDETSEAPKKSANKYKDAAITKIMQANPGLPDYKAQCMVEEITKDGVYGLGEINQMKLSGYEMSENKESLNEAYYAAMRLCQK